MFAITLPADHLNVGITSIKLGRALLRQNRVGEAENHSLAGYRILSKQTSPSVTWLKTAREDLAAIYRAMGQPEKAAGFLTAQAGGAPGGK
jgi:serine/threonine-protein kinase